MQNDDKFELWLRGANTAELHDRRAKAWVRIASMTADVTTNKRHHSYEENSLVTLKIVSYQLSPTIYMMNF